MVHAGIPLDNQWDRWPGTTYQLPIRFRLFAKRGEKGERRNYVAYGHALLITSNGQVHSHWSPQDFKVSTKLNKLYDRVLVVVESDALPIEVRTELFTADRAQLVEETGRAPTRRSRVASVEASRRPSTLAGRKCS